MGNQSARWIKFKKFLKRNMTPTWAKHFAYQVFSFILSVAIVFFVTDYAVTKTYEERTLKFVNGFQITAHTGSEGSAENSIESLKKAVECGADAVEFDVRQRLDGTLVMSHDIVSEANAVPVEEALEYLSDKNIDINFDVKESACLGELHALIEKYNLFSKCVLTGIEISDIKNVKMYCSDVEYYLNYSPSRMKIFTSDYRQRIISLLENTGAVGINCHYRYASETLSKELHSNGYKLSVWTVDKEKTMKRVLVLKPDNITTRQVNLLREVINNWDK